MTVALAVVVGYLAGRLCWIVLRPTWSAPGLLRHNHRGHPVPTAAGVVVPVTVVLVEAGRAVAGTAGVGGEGVIGAARLAVVVTAVGMGLAGLIDDLADSVEVRGFGGHLRALGRGQLTTGGLKVVIGAGVALLVAILLAGYLVRRRTRVAG